MLNKLYVNIGGKIKDWAKWIFVTESIAAIIGGICLIADWEELLGIMTIIFGPVVAYVSSWILYAFGEIVEDIHAMRNKYYPQTEEQLNRETEEKAKREVEEIAYEKAQTFTCPNCQKDVYYGNPMCECGQTFDWSKL